MPSIRHDPAHWFRRAHEARRLAESVTDAEAQRTLLKIVEEYERLAQRAADRRDGDDANALKEP